MKTFLIKAEYTFEVTREVKASDYQEALNHVKNNCSCTWPKYISLLSDSDIDWNGSVHPVRINYSKSKRDSLFS